MSDQEDRNMSDQKDVVEIIRAALVQAFGEAYVHDEAPAIVEALEAKGYTITRGSQGVRHRQEPFESK
jgi:RNase P/RNase MRP subunit POP5